jgi:DNA-binding NtrC family response regulator
MTMEAIEKEAIRRTLEQFDGHRAQTAESLAISVRTLHRKIKEYGLEV